MLKKIGTLITSLSIALAPTGSLLSSTFSRATIGALVGTSAVMLPSAAHAQSGYRICAVSYGLSAQMGVTLLMKVSKYDPGTCPASWVAINSVTGFGMGRLVGAAIRAGLSKSTYFNAPCEKFST